MNHFGEIHYLGELVRPDIAVISNIGDAHIEFLGSREGILKAKSEIFDFLKPGGTAILNGDDALLNTLELPFTTLRCGQSEHCGVRVTDVSDHGLDGITCRVTTKKDVYDLTINAPGQHLVYCASMRRTVAPLQPFKTKKPLANYKLVILGTPVWAGRCSSVIRGFLKEQGYLLTNVSYVLLRSGNGKCEEVYQQMDKYLSQPHRTAVSLRAGSVGYRFWQEEFLRRTRAFLEGEEIQD